MVCMFRHASSFTDGPIPSGELCQRLAPWRPVTRVIKSSTTCHGTLLGDHVGSVHTAGIPPSRLCRHERSCASRGAVRVCNPCHASRVRVRPPCPRGSAPWMAHNICPVAVGTMQHVSNHGIPIQSWSLSDSTRGYQINRFGTPSVNSHALSFHVVLCTVGQDTTTRRRATACTGRTGMTHASYPVIGYPAVASVHAPPRPWRAARPPRLTYPSLVIPQALPLPRDPRARLDERQRLLPARPQSGEPDPQRPFTSQDRVRCPGR